MRKRKFDKAVTRTVMKALDTLARRLGLDEVRHGATKWNKGQQDKARLFKQRRALEQELAEVSRRLSR